MSRRGRRRGTRGDREAAYRSRTVVLLTLVGFLAIASHLWSWIQPHDRVRYLSRPVHTVVALEREQALAEGAERAGVELPLRLAGVRWRSPQEIASQYDAYARRFAGELNSWAYAGADELRLRALVLRAKAGGWAKQEALERSLEEFRDPVRVALARRVLEFHNPAWRRLDPGLAREGEAPSDAEIWSAAKDLEYGSVKRTVIAALEPIAPVREFGVQTQIVAGSPEASEERARRIARVVQALSAIALLGALGTGILLRNPQRARLDPLDRPHRFVPFHSGLGLFARYSLILTLVLWLFAPAIGLPLGYLLGSLPLLWFARRRIPEGRERRAQLGLSVRSGAAFRCLLLGGVGWGLFCFGLLALSPLRAFRAGDPVTDPMVFGSALGTGLPGGYTFAALALAPLFEEQAFRGALYGGLRSRLGVPSALLLSSGLFTVGHSYTLGPSLVVFWGAVVAAVFFERTRSVWPSIVMHALWNLTAVGIAEL